MHKRISFRELRRVWTDCVEASFHEHERDSIWQESQRRRKEANDEWNKQHPKQKPRTDTSLWIKALQITPTERSIQEVCKYVTKADSWSKMRKQDLKEIAMISRWNRMFELFGSFALRNTSEDSGTERAIVHTRSFTDGEKPHRLHWREIIANSDPEVYLIALEDAIERQIFYGYRELWQKFPNRQIISADQLPEEVFN
jgi:hypothetical protein